MKQKAWKQHRCLILLLPILLLGCSEGVTERTSIGGVLGAGGAHTEMGMDLWVSQRCAEAGEPVAIRYTLTNEGPGKLVVQLKDAPAMDIVIQINTRENQKQFVRWSDGQPLTDELTQLVLEPGQSKTISMDWPVDPRTSFAFVSMDFSYHEDPPRGRTDSVTLYVSPNCVGGPGP